MNQKKYVICDIDGTIANLEHRLHFVFNEDGTKKRYKDTDWEGFHKACADDTPYEDVIAVVRALSASGYRVVFVSGRNATVRDETITWLYKHIGVLQFPVLLMRNAADRRPDTEVKLEMAQREGLTPDNVLCVLDDRQSDKNLLENTELHIYVAAYINEELWRGNSITPETIENAIAAFCGGAR